MEKVFGATLGRVKEYFRDEDTSSQDFDPYFDDYSGYHDLYTFYSAKIPYFDGLRDAHIPKPFFIREQHVHCVLSDYEYHVPDEFRQNLSGINLGVNRDGDKFRLVCYKASADDLRLTFAKIKYSCHLITGKCLDKICDRRLRTTFRDKYAKRIPRGNINDFPCSNICGVGLLLLSKDNKLIVTKQNTTVHVYHNYWTYSASGTMDYSQDPNPFDDIARETREEINHEIDREKLRLEGFGLDTREFFYQFSFVENTERTADAIIHAAYQGRDFDREKVEIAAVEFEPKSISKFIKEKEWEPSCLVSLLNLAVKHFGYLAIRNAVFPKDLEEIGEQWQRRAKRWWDFVTASNSYGKLTWHRENVRYRKAVKSFLGQSVRGKKVIEPGCGNGRITSLYVKDAKSILCVDISQQMLHKHGKRLRRFRKKITYHVPHFIEEVDLHGSFDVAIISLVLIHILDDERVALACQKVCEHCESVFLFENTAVNREVSLYTRIRSEDELLHLFPGFRVEKKERYTLFSDDISFVHLVRVA